MDSLGTRLSLEYRAWPLAAWLRLRDIKLRDAKGCNTVVLITGVHDTRKTRVRL